MERPQGTDLALLRASVQELQQRLSRICDIRLATTALLLVFFAAGIFQGPTNDIRQKIGEIQAFANDHNINQAPLDPLTLMFVRPLWIPKVADASNLDEVLGTLTRMTDQLSELYRQSFLVSASILGTTIKADLRLVVLILPVVFSVFDLYIALYRHKRNLTAGLAAMACGRDAGTSVVDSLWFNSNYSMAGNFYRDCSLQVTDFLYRILLGCLLATVAWFARSFLDSGAATWPLTAFFIWSLTIVLFFRMMAAYLSRLLSVEFEQRFQVTIDERPQAPATGMIGRRLLQFPGSYTRPIGALLVLATLTLATTVTTTDPTKNDAPPGPREASWLAIPQTGISILVLHDYWLPSLLDGTEHLMPEEESKWLHAFGSFWYALAVAVALLHLLACCRVFGRDQQRTYGWLSLVTMAVFSQILLQFAAYLFLSAAWLLVWVFLAIERIGRPWRLISRSRSVLNALSPHAWPLVIPIVIANVLGLLYIMAATQGDPRIRPVWGLPIYYLGVLMLAHSIYADRARYAPSATR